MTSLAVRRRDVRPDGAARRALALVFPFLSAERLRATRPHLFVGAPRTALAFVTEDGAAARLVALDAAATRAGLDVGMTVAEARARVPDLVVHRDDPVADYQWLEQLAESCGRYTAAVTLRPPDALILDIAAIAEPYGGEHGLVCDLESRLARRGLVARHACGDGPATAEALARFAGAPAPDERGAVRRLPLAALYPDDEAAAALMQAGMRTVGDVIALPTATVAARFGLAVAARVRQLTGAAERRKPATPTPPPVSVERILDGGAARDATLRATVTDLAVAAAASLAAWGEGGRRWRLRLFRIDGTVASAVVDLGQPTADPAVPIRRLCARIAAFADPRAEAADRRVDLVRLDVMLVDPCGAGLLALDGIGAGRPAPSGRSRGARRPRQADRQAELPLAAGPPPDGQWPSVPCPREPTRPIHLLDPPQRIDAADAAPAGPPRRFRWRRQWYDVTRVEGPERITTDAPRGGMGEAARDYWRITDRRGRALWIFSPIAGDGGTGQSCWYVHGLFA